MCASGASAALPIYQKFPQTAELNAILYFIPMTIDYAHRGE
jgi:hypothetical protein